MSHTSSPASKKDSSPGLVVGHGTVDGRRSAPGLEAEEEVGVVRVEGIDLSIDVEPNYVAIRIHVLVDFATVLVVINAVGDCRFRRVDGKGRRLL